MKITDLVYDYPEELIATAPQRPSRVMWVGADESQMPEEISVQDLLLARASGEREGYAT